MHAKSTSQLSNTPQQTITEPGVEALADKSLIGCLKLLVALHRDKRLRAMCTDPRLRHVRVFTHTNIFTPTYKHAIVFACDT